MQPSRRRFVGAILGGATVAVGGCTASSGGSSDAGEGDGSNTAEEDGSSDAQAGRLVARLEGPDETYRLFDGDAISDVGEVQLTQSGSYGVPIQLEESATSAMVETFREAEVAEDRASFEIVLAFDGEVLNRSGMTRGLVEEIETGGFEGQFLVIVPDRETATELREALI